MNVPFACAYHVVWCPKHHRRVIGGRVETRLQTIIAEVTAEKGARLIELETMPDQVHLLVEVDPKVGIHKLVKAIKGRSSRLLRQEFGWLRSRLPTLWTNSYFVATVGGAPRSVINRYVDDQKSTQWVGIRRFHPSGGRQSLQGYSFARIASNAPVAPRDVRSAGSTDGRCGTLIA